ncbi:MAG TPA: Ig-like domain-containing protein [Gammaproteobacteria bacterium]
MKISGTKNYATIEKALLLTVLACVSSMASAQEYWLCSGATTQVMPDTGEVITLWGFASDDDNDLSNGCGNPVQVPGPSLQVPPEDPSLIVHLRNDLDDAVSIVIPGQNTSMTPVMFTDGQGRQRVRSFTHETDPYATSSTTGLYTWSNVEPGTYLYQSGTHPAVQIQMGLYGSMVKNAAAGMAYPGIAYDNEVMLLYSEIDPALHTAVVDGSYGTPAYPSTVHYQPRYFLINGQAYTSASAALANLVLGETTLIRMLNAGLQSHVPTLQTHINLIAEDGNPYAYGKNQYSILLPAGKTMDALFTPVNEGRYSIHDSRLFLTNANVTGGGMLAFLDVAAITGAPVAVDDTYNMVEDSNLAVSAPGILGNDTGAAPLTAIITSAITTGNLVLNTSDGSFSYTPPADFSGGASFSYRVNDGTTDSNIATVHINIAPINDAPIAGNDIFDTNQNTTLNVSAPGVLANDSDVDGNVLQSLVQTLPANGSLSLASDGSFTYIPSTGFSGADSFTYVADDGNGGVSNIATVDINVNLAPNVAPVANDDYAETVRSFPVTIDLVANDTDIDGTIDPTTVVIVTPPQRGTVVNNGDGTVTYEALRRTPGSDAFSYQVIDNNGAVSNTGVVRISILRR